MTAIPLAVVRVPGLRPADFLSRRFRQALPTLPESEVAAMMRQLADLGENHFPYVVEGLAHKRPAVSAASRTVIGEQLSRWKLLPAYESSRRVAQLASQLAAIIPALDEVNRQFAADLAGRILTWPVDRKSTNSLQLVHDCEVILSAIAANSNRARSGTKVANREVHAGPLPDYEQPQEPVPEGPDFSASDLPAVSKEAVPLMVADPVQLPPATAISPTTNPRIRRLDPDIETDESDAPWSEGKAPKTLRLGDEIRELIHSLHSPDLRVTSQAIRRLRRHGFQDRDFTLAAKLDDPDPDVRRQLAESLPGQNGIDPRAWLLWLSDDPDASVRRIVAAIMATSGDPLLSERLQVMEREDADAEVVELARRRVRR